MRRRVVSAAVALVVAIGSSPLWSQSRDEEAVREMVKRYLDARDRGDEAGVRALFTEDADQLVSSGEWRRGRDTIVTGTLASTKRSGGTRRITVETIRFLTKDVALADGRYEITGSQTQADRRMWSTFLMVRQADGWRIAAIRNMLPAQ
jgi:uncharacterized protein (TIGR02246 family)